MSPFMPYKSSLQRRFFKLCSTPKGRRKAKGKCPPMSVIRKYKKHK